MSNKLTNKSCEACRVDAPILTESEIQNLLPQIPSWKIFEDEGIKKLICSYAFLNYIDSVNFTNKIADLAEQEDHHPEIILEWGKVSVFWWSHKIKGLHMNDFVCAAKTDKLFNTKS